MIRRCNNCNERYAYDRFNTDFVHRCVNASLAVIQEDIKKIGDWDDYTGSDVNVPESITQIGGAANKFWGKDAELDGANLETLSPRGVSLQIYRQRQRLEYNENI